MAAMTPTTLSNKPQGRWRSSVQWRTNLVAIGFGFLLALVCGALLHHAIDNAQRASALLAQISSGPAADEARQLLRSSLWFGSLSIGALLLYFVVLPWYLRDIYRQLRVNNLAVRRLLQGDTQLPPLPLHRRDEFGQTARALVRLRDLTQELRQQSQLDALTGLANRKGLELALGQALVHCSTSSTHLALLILDLKRFRHLNHAYGVSIGDRALQQAALRLKVALPQAIGIARLQADRYALALSLPHPAVASRPLAEQAIARIRQQLAAPLTLDGHLLTLDVRAGIALFPQDGQDVPTLMIAAEAALALARSDGSEHLRFADPELAQRAQRTAGVVAEIRRGLAAGEFVPHYEPIVDLTTGDIRGVEALARWQHPQRGLVSPAEFIPVAEDMGMIEALTSALLPQICPDAARWSAAGDPRGVSINLSARELNAGFVERLAEALRHSQLDPARVTVELTETAMVENPEQALQVLQVLKALGVTLSLDDFGTGYSSLSYLQRFPIDNVKIDRSFVAELPHSRRARQLVGAILSMAHELNLGVVAEGVETQQQARLLAEMGCPRQQGYLYARAQSAAGLNRQLLDIQGQLYGLRLAA